MLSLQSRHQCLSQRIAQPRGEGSDFSSVLQEHLLRISSDPIPPLPVGNSLLLAFLKSPRGGPESAGSSPGQRLLGRPFPALRLYSRTVGFRGVNAPTLSTPNGCFQTLTSDPDDGASLPGGGPGFFHIHLPVAAIPPSSPSEHLQPALVLSPGLPSRASVPKARLHQWMQVSGWGAQGRGMDSQCKSGLPAEN